VLQSLLADFQGTILLVSHDRYLIDASGDPDLGGLPRPGRPACVRGQYSEYKTALQTEAAQQSASKVAATEQEREGRQRTGPSKNSERRQRERVRAIEDEITSLETRLAGIARQLENPPADPAEVARLGQQYTELQHALEQRLADWSQLAEKAA
jgi:ATP-binding cassette, subfamily F, member 3